MVSVQVEEHDCLVQLSKLADETVQQPKLLVQFRDI
jgi:hypothetical protein